MVEKCRTCGKEPSPDCDYHQGRCEYNKKELAPPDPTLHRNISFVKSGLRIAAGLALTTSHIYVAGVLLILAEILGIVEEIV
jgi:hypothetical protein